MESQSITLKDARTHPICLTVEQAEEVIDALRWVDDEWEDMDEADRITHKGMRDVFNSILDQYPIHETLYPEPQGEPSY